METLSTHMHRLAESNSRGLDIPITTGRSPVTIARITVPNDKPCEIISVKVNVDITHSDLLLLGVSLFRNQLGATLYYQACHGSGGLAVTFDDNSADTISCPASADEKLIGTFQMQTISLGGLS